MRIIDCQQGSEQWELLRMTRPTASQFDRIITPARGDLSKQHRKYACELVAKQLGLHVEMLPTVWMDNGEEQEPLAIADYCERNGTVAETVGFVLPDDTDSYGCSPDALVFNRNGVLEVKCPKPDTLLMYHWDGVLPDEHKVQVQGQLLVTGCSFCDFFAWHPELKPFQIRVEPDLKFHDAMLNALAEFNAALAELREKVSRSGTHLIQWGK